MGSSYLYETYVYRLIGMTPTLAVMVVGVVLALRNLPRHSRPCWALLAALALSGFNNLIMPMIVQTLVTVFPLGYSDDSRYLMTILTTLPYSIIGAISWGLILFAIFDRPAPPKFLVEDELDRDILDSPSGRR